MTNIDQKIISFDEAKKIAEEMAVSDLKAFITNRTDESLLQNRWLEAENCWMFFRTKQIPIPQESWFKASYCAYAISKKGTARSITDFSDDPEKLQDYLKSMSDHFKQRGM